MNPYEVLGIDKNATEDEIKKAYRQKAKEHHPDVGGDEEKFKKVQAAYDTLTNPNKKASHDYGGGFPGWGGGSGGSAEFDSMEDFLNNVFQFRNNGGFNFNGGNRRKKKHVGGNIRINIAIDLEDVATGTVKKIKYKRKVHCTPCSGTGAKDGKESTCDKCNGSGYIQNNFNVNGHTINNITNCDKCVGTGKITDAHCSTCAGHGVVDKEEIVDLNIPAGTVNGSQFEVSKAGNFPKGDGSVGSLLFVITVNEHPIFTRIDSNLHCDVFISVIDALLGSSNIEVPVINGRVKITIDPGVENGTVLRLQGKGLHSMNHPNMVGDQFIHINIYIPKNISDKEKLTLSGLSKSDSFTVTREKTQHLKGSFMRMSEFRNIEF